MWRCESGVNMSQILLGIDIGTYSSKGVLVEPNGRVLQTYVVEHSVDIPKPGWAEQDADKVWWGDVVEICHSLINSSPYTGADIAGVAISAIGPCMLPLDSHGKPLRPGILYGIDTRASAEIEYLNRIIGADKIFEFSRMILSSQAVGPKILWLKNNEPEIWKQVDRITTASSYIIYKLTGEHVIDRHTASHYIPLMNLQMEWDPTFADYIIDIEKLPRLGWSNEIAGVISPSGAIATGLRSGIPVAVGAVDALSEAISVGVTDPGDLMIMYGSTAFFILVQELPTPDRRMWSIAGAYQGQYNLAAGMSTAGSLTRWFRDQLALDLAPETAYSVLFERASKIPPGSNGLLILPYFSGERTPINDPQARGVIAGLTLAHTRDHLFRAILESVAFGIKHNLDTFREIGAQIHRVVAVGGGTKSRVWPQIVTDVSNTPQIIPKLTIGASYGDAFLAGLAAGILKKDDIKTWVKQDYIAEPDRKKNEKYQKLYENYLQLYEKTKNIVHQLGEG